MGDGTLSARSRWSPRRPSWTLVFPFRSDRRGVKVARVTTQERQEHGWAATGGGLASHTGEA